MAAHSYRITSRKNLTANQAGQFSDQQREALKKETHSYLKPILLVIAGSLVLLCLALLVLARGNFLVVIGVVAGMDPLILGAIGFVAVPPILLMLVFGQRKTRGIARDLAENNILSSDGEVVWKKGWLFSTSRYVAVTTAGRRLKMLFGNLRIPPGKYRFYFLGRGRWILSVDKLSGELSDLMPALEQVFGFTLEDLEANRRGELTVRQARKMQREVLSVIFTDMIEMFGKFGLIGIAGLGLFVSLADLSFLTWVVLAFLYLAVILGFRVRKSFARQRLVLDDVAEMRVENAEGIRKYSRAMKYQDPETGEESSVSVRYMTVRGTDHRFPIGSDGDNALVRSGGIEYRVFYTPYSGNLASVEPIRKTRGKGTK